MCRCSGLVITGSEPNADDLETEHDRRRFQVNTNSVVMTVLCRFRSVVFCQLVTLACYGCDNAFQFYIHVLVVVG